MLIRRPCRHWNWPMSFGSSLLDVHEIMKSMFSHESSSRDYCISLGTVFEHTGAAERPHRCRSGRIPAPHCWNCKVQHAHSSRQLWIRTTGTSGVAVNQSFTERRIAKLHRQETRPADDHKRERSWSGSFQWWRCHVLSHLYPNSCLYVGNK